MRPTKFYLGLSLELATQPLLYETMFTSHLTQYPIFVYCADTGEQLLSKRRYIGIKIARLEYMLFKAENLTGEKKSSLAVRGPKNDNTWNNQNSIRQAFTMLTPGFLTMA